MLSEHEMTLALELVQKASVEQLQMISAKLRASFAFAGYVKKNEVRVGDTVEWDSPRTGTVMRGRVEKIMRKNLEVKIATGQIWRVSPVLVRLL